MPSGGVPSGRLLLPRMLPRLVSLIPEFVSGKLVFICLANLETTNFEDKHSTLKGWFGLAHFIITSINWK